MELLFIVGRILLGGFFLVNAYGHFKNVAGLSGYAKSKGVFMPRESIIASGVLLLIAGLSIVLGAYVRVGLLAAILFLVLITPKMHNFWKETDPMMRMNQKIAFQKNLAILGGVLMLLSLATPWTNSL